MAQQNFKLGFAENFMLSGAAAAISKTAAAPIERVKLLVQNQNEMIKQGTLSEPYKGVIDCTVRTFKTEGKQFLYLFQRVISVSWAQSSKFWNESDLRFKNMRINLSFTNNVWRRLINNAA